MRNHRTVFLFPLSFLLFAFVSFAVARDLPDFTELAAENAAAVVNISTRQNRSGKNFNHHRFNMPGLPEDSPLNDLFKRFFDDHLGEEFSGRDMRSLGSGFIISDDGYLLTNYHVVQKADEIIVHLSDRKSFDAKLVGYDKASDIAVLKIEAKDLPTLKLGSSKNLKVGEWVLAIGSPFGFDHTVTAGIVSAKGRNLPSENYVPFIQTDVAINPGNSGGPLFNLDGEVVGINSQIYSRTGGFMGLSFAIPIELAISVADQIRDNGHVARGYLGVLIQDVDRELADSFGLDHPHGALIAKIIENSPAASANLQIGDVILEFDGHKLRNSGQLPPLVGSTAIGERIKLKVLRNKKREDVEIKIGQLPADSGDKKSSKQADIEPNELLGLTLDDSQGEVKVLSAKGLARNAGIETGDVILRFNNEIVKSISDLKSAVEKTRHGDSVAVLVQKKEGPVFLALHMTD